MKATITTPDELTILQIEGSNGTYKIFSSFRPTESPTFVDAIEQKYNKSDMSHLMKILLSIISQLLLYY